MKTNDQVESRMALDVEYSELCSKHSKISLSIQFSHGILLEIIECLAHFMILPLTLLATFAFTLLYCFFIVVCFDQSKRATFFTEMFVILEGKWTVFFGIPLSILGLYILNRRNNFEKLNHDASETMDKILRNRLKFSRLYTFEDVILEYL